MKSPWFKPFQLLTQFLNTMAGVPNYEQYLTHFRKHHPDKTPLSPEDFHRQATEEKYNGKTIRRCC